MDWVFMSPQNSYFEILITSVMLQEVGPLGGY